MTSVIVKNNIFKNTFINKVFSYFELKILTFKT